MATKNTSQRSGGALTASVYTADGKQADTIELPRSVFGQPWNPDLVHQVVTANLANARRSWAHTKDRGEISGGGKKPWRQKGTGRARHGSTRSPIWRHGGVTHGPRNTRSFAQKINRKMRVNALFTVLSKKYADGEVLLVSNLGISEPKTKRAREVLNTLGAINGFKALASRRKNAAYVILPSEDAAVKKSFRNMSNMLVGTVGTMNTVDLLTYKYLVLADPKTTAAMIEAKAK